MSLGTIARRLWQEEEGQDLTEYVLLIVVIALGCIAAMGQLATAISQAFFTASTNLTGTT